MSEGLSWEKENRSEKLFYSVCELEKNERGKET